MTTPPDTVALQEEERTFYAALGKALTQWQRIEENLAIIFASVAGRHGLPDMAANAAFHAVLNFNTKLAMTDSAIKMKSFLSVLEREPGVSDPMIGEWDTLKNRAERRAKRRNELAHFALAFDRAKTPGNRYTLQPSAIDMRAWMLNAGNPPTRYTRDLVDQGNSFENLGFDLSLFYLRWLWPRDASGPPAAYSER
jgi:hypothetical protein